jgi:hypothetical protein
VRRPDGGVRAGGGALLEILDALPGGWLLRPWARLPGAEAVVDAAYRWVARRRRLFGALLARQRGDRGPACALDVPPALDSTPKMQGALIGRPAPPRRRRAQARREE